MQSIDFPTEKCPIFYQVPKAFCSSKNVQIPSPSLPDRGQTLSITCPTCSQYSISSFRELPVMCKVHKGTDLLSRDSPLILQGPTDMAVLMKILLHSSLLQQFWFPSGPYTYTLLKENLSYSQIIFCVDAHLSQCELLEIKNYVIYHHFYYLKHSTQSLTYSEGSISLLN